MKFGLMKVCIRVMRIWMDLVEFSLCGIVHGESKEDDEGDVIWMKVVVSWV